MVQGRGEKVDSGPGKAGFGDGPLATNAFHHNINYRIDLQIQPWALALGNHQRDGQSPEAADHQVGDQFYIILVDFF
jgi:hypothetical protein